VRVPSWLFDNRNFCTHGHGSALSSTNVSSVAPESPRSSVFKFRSGAHSPSAFHAGGPSETHDTCSDSSFESHACSVSTSTTVAGTCHVNRSERHR
jgi:hypothetical protein